MANNDHNSYSKFKNNDDNGNGARGAGNAMRF